MTGTIDPVGVSGAGARLNERLGMARISAEDRRSALVAAALRVIDRAGVQGASTRAIVAEAGMALASFHYAFSSRDELIRAVMAHVMQAEERAAFAAMLPAVDAAAEGSEIELRDLLRAAFRGYLEHLTANPGHEQAMFELFHNALRTPGLEDLARCQYEAYRDLAATALEVGAVHARIRWSVPLDDVARIVVSLVDGLTLAWLADRDTDAALRFIDAACDMVAALAEPALEGARNRGTKE